MSSGTKLGISVLLDSQLVLTEGEEHRHGGRGEAAVCPHQCQ